MSQQPQPGELLLGRYRVAEAAGETALWTAVRATDEQAARGSGEGDVLIKLVRPELAHDEPSRAYVLREMLRVRLLQHPGIVRPADVQIIEGEDPVVAIIEPGTGALSQGVLLHKMARYRKEQGERFTIEEVRRTGLQLASALSYVHSQLLCHGDLRPDVVLLKPDGVRLCDVGLGRALPRGPYLDEIGRAHV